MKTTLENPDELFRQAKTVASLRAISLKTFVTKSLEMNLCAGPFPTASTGPAKAWDALGAVNAASRTGWSGIPRRRFRLRGRGPQVQGDHPRSRGCRTDDHRYAHGKYRHRLRTPYCLTDY